MMIIPALHDAASDQPIRYTPACSHAAVPVCLNPAYAAYLPVVTAALQPVLSEIAGLPGAPGRISQGAPAYQQEPGNGISIGTSGILLLPDQLPGGQQPAISTAEFAAQVRQNTGTAIVFALVDGSNKPLVLTVRAGQAPAPHQVQALQARLAVADALLKDAGLPVSGGYRGIAAPLGSAGQGPVSGPEPGPGPGSQVYAAARRFAALPAAARHAWLGSRLAALRAGQITLAQLP